MQAGPGTDGIQKLLAAETDAQRIVADARKAKQDRLRQAKAEAEKEIAAYKAEREGVYQKKVAEAGTGSAATFQRLTNETQLTVQKIQSDVATKKSQIVDILMGYTANVKFA